MYLVFLKLLQGLRTPYSVKYKTKGALQAKICREYSYTTEEVIFTALSSIACFGQSDEEVEQYISKDSKTNTSSLALVMGTFADEVNADNAYQLDENEAQLKEQLMSTQFYEKGLVEYSHDPKTGDVIYRVDNKHGGREEVEKYRHLLELLMQNKFKKYAIPVKWLELGMCLQLHAELKKVHFVCVSDCEQIGRRLNMTEGMVKAALQFLHKYIGLILYFPENENLKNYVICDHQYVFSSISELIFEVYNPKKHLISDSKCQEFIETGCFTPEDIKTSEKSNSEKRLPIKDLVEILLHLNIVAPCQSSYFLPAVLRSAKTEQLMFPTNDGSCPEPLCLSFETGYLPLGFVCALIARLTSEGTFKLRGPKQKCEINRNKVTFCLRGRYIITLISWPKYCEFRVSRPDGARTDEEYHSENSCPLIRDTVHNAVNHIIKSMTQNSVFHLSQIYKLGFKCPNHKSETDYGHEPLAVFDLNDVDNIMCQQCGLTPKFSVHNRVNAWFAPRITTQPLSPEKELNIEESIRLTITATGARLLEYQWIKDKIELGDSQNFQGSKSSSLNIRVTSEQQKGIYSCEVTNKFGRVSSDKVSVVINVTGEQ